MVAFSIYTHNVWLFLTLQPIVLAIQNNVSVTGISLCLPIAVSATYYSFGNILTAILMFTQEPIMKLIKSDTGADFFAYFYFQLGIAIVIIAATIVYILQVFERLPTVINRLDKPRSVSMIAQSIVNMSQPLSMQ